MGHSEGQIYGYIHLPCKINVNARLEPKIQLTEARLG
jgi:hypothetical protein